MVVLEKDNGKAKLVRLTEVGRQLTEQTAVRLFEAERAAFAEWSEEELRMYLELIRKNNATLKQQIEKL